MKQYETMYIVKSSLEEAARKELMESMHGIITAHGGKIDKVDEWGMRDFAYRIEDMTKGYYVVVTYTVDVDGLNEFDRLMRINNNIVRMMTISTDEKHGKQFMINRVVLVGRLTKDIEVRKIPSGASTTTFTLACDRRYQGRDNNGPSADFIQCVAWRQSADFLGQYARKGSVVAVDGHITTRNYEGQNGRVYVTEVTCENVRIISSSNRSENTYAASNVTHDAPQTDYSAADYSSDEDFSSTPSLDVSSDDLPFY